MTQNKCTLIKTYMDESSSQSVYSARCLGQEQYHQYTTDVLALGKKSFYGTIKWNKFPLYRSTNKVVLSKISHITETRSPFVLSLHVACESRKGDLHQFFSHTTLQHYQCMVSFVILILNLISSKNSTSMLNHP